MYNLHALIFLLEKFKMEVGGGSQIKHGLIREGGLYMKIAKDIWQTVKCIVMAIYYKIRLDIEFVFLAKDIMKIERESE